MNKIVYSPDALEKMRYIRQDVERRFDSAIAGKAVAEIINAIQRLKENPYLGVSVSEIYGVDTSYRRIFAAHNHIFYEVDRKTIRIIDIYNEREDFIFKLFGVDSADKEAEAYWNEAKRDRK